MTSSITTRTAPRVNARKCSWNICCSGNAGDACSNAKGSVFDVVLFFLGTGIVVPSCLKWNVFGTRDKLCLYYLFNFSSLGRALFTQKTGWCPSKRSRRTTKLLSLCTSSCFCNTPSQVEPVETFRLTRVEESHEDVIRARHSRSPLLPPWRQQTTRLVRP